jgi:hypothetical protein
VKKLTRIFEGIKEEAAFNLVFRRDLLEEPEKTFMRFASRPLPEGYRFVEYKEQLENDKTILLPEINPDILSGDDLLKVVGGATKDVLLLILGLAAVISGVFSFIFFNIF